MVYLQLHPVSAWTNLVCGTIELAMGLVIVKLVNQGSKETLTYVLGICMACIGLSNLLYFIFDSFHEQFTVDGVLITNTNIEGFLITSLLFNLASLESWIFACQYLRSAS
jgi:hypothetical protein